MRVRKVAAFILIILLMINIPLYASEPNQTIFAKSKNADTFSSHFVKVNGINLHYIEMGKGPLIVLLHGWPETSYAWRFVMPALAKKYRVVAPDLPGLGLSECTQSGYDKKTIATDIKDLVVALGANHAIIIGHDMGGKAAYVMAHLYPQYVSKLILVDCLIPGTENADALHGGAWHYDFHMALYFPEMLTQGREKEYISALIKGWLFKKMRLMNKQLMNMLAIMLAKVE